MRCDHLLPGRRYTGRYRYRVADRARGLIIIVVVADDA